MSPGDGAVIVTTPQVNWLVECANSFRKFKKEVALSDVRKEISFCMKTKVGVLGVIENMSGFVCPHCKVNG